MGFTEAERVFGGIHEGALNDFIRAFCLARPRLLRYGSPAFVPSTTVDATAMAAIDFPGIAGGVDWAIAFDIPVVDLHTQTAPLPPELGLGLGQFSVRTVVKLCVDCRRRLNPPTSPSDDRPKDKDPHQEPHHREDEGRPHHAEGETCAALDVFGIGHLEVVSGPGGVTSVRMRVDAMELVDVGPDDLETVLECVMRMLLDAAVAQIVLPIEALRAGAFTLTLLRGPEIEDDQLKVYGNV
jgi:hypothetical protein